MLLFFYGGEESKKHVAVRMMNAVLSTSFPPYLLLYVADTHFPNDHRIEPLVVPPIHSICWSDPTFALPPSLLIANLVFGCFHAKSIFNEVALIQIDVNLIGSRQVASYFILNFHTFMFLFVFFLRLQIQ